MSGKPRPTRYSDRGDGSVYQRCEKAYGCPARVEQVQPDGTTKLVRPKHTCRGMWIGQAPPMYVDGKVQRPTTSARSKQRAKTKLRALMKRVGEFGYVPAAARATKLGDWIDSWLTAASENDLRNSSTERYRSVVRKWIWPTLGGIALRDVTPQHVRYLYSKMSDAGSSGSRPAAHNVLLASLRQAEEEGLIDTSPMSKVSAPNSKTSKKKNVGFPRDEWVKLLDVIESRPVSQRARWLLQAYTGMRRGECLGLTWESVNMDTGVIKVAHQLTRIAYTHGCEHPGCDKKQPSKCPARVSMGANPDRIELSDYAALDLVKTDGSERIVPMVDDLWMVMKELQDSGGFPEFEGWHLVFHSDGTRIEQTSDNRALRAIQDEAGIPRRGTHSFRRSVATRLMEAGAPQRVIQAILGHASSTMTMVYQEAEIEYVREVMSSLSVR